MRSWLLMFLLLSSVMIQDAQGIRLIKGSAPSDSDGQHQHRLHARIEGGIDESKTKKLSGRRKRKLSSRERKEAHHWLPRIHEDYYGPRMHRPKHH